jgi:hypothetical protein
MKLRIPRLPILSTPLALALVFTPLACSNSSASSGDDAGSGTPDSSTSSPTPDSSTSSTTPDSSTSTSPDSSTSTSPDSSTAQDGGTLSFSRDIYAPIIEHHCVGCHGFTPDGGAGPGIAFGNLDLSSVDAGYANLVNVPAAGVACGATDGATAPIRVVPGSAATSLLYEKVDGFTTPPPCGHAMPESGEIPDGGQAIVAQQIETWINQGALP